MNVDPSVNVVVVEVQRGGQIERLIGRGPTQAADCVEAILLEITRGAYVNASDVTRIYSEWQPTEADYMFLNTAFPQAAVTYSFPRPSPDGWDDAFREAALVMKRSSDEAKRPPS